MRKVIVNIARSSLVAAFCCSACFAQTAETSRAGTATRFNGTDSRLPQSPRELLKRGKELYLLGEFAKAVKTLEQIDPDADLSAKDAAMLPQLLESARKKAGVVPERTGVTTRAQSPDARGTDSEAAAGLAALKKEALRLADALPDDRKAAAAKWMRSARAAFNQGDVDAAEQIAQAALQIDAPFKGSEDSPDKLLVEIQDSRKQDAAWRNDQTSPQAKRNRSNYLLGRAEKAIQQGDSESAQRFLAAAEQIKVTPGVMDLKPSTVRQHLEALLPASKPTVARAATKSRTAPRGGIQQVGYEQPAAVSKDSPDAMRVKADKALREAVLAEKQGHFKEAWRLASQAQQLETEGHLKYGVGEQRPSQYRAELASRMPGDPASLAIMEKEIARNKSAADENLAFAEDLMVKAKKAMQAGDLRTARENVEHVLDLKIDLESLSERPEALLDELDRRAVATVSHTKPRVKATAGTSPRTNGDKAKALQLLAEAKAAMEAGDLQKARAKTLAAEQIKVVYDAFESDPAHLMAQIDEAAVGRRGDGKMLANAGVEPDASLFEPETTPRTGSAATGTRTASRTGRRTSPLPAPVKKQRAMELVEMARAELQAGRIADAKRLAKEAEEINTPYSLLEDRPELVLADIELAEASQGEAPAANKRAAKPDDERSKVEVAAETREPDLAKRQASLLLKQARLDLKANRVDLAEQKALQAEKLDASYSEWEDTPALVMKEVERANGVFVADRSGQATENPFEDSADAVVSQAGMDAAVINPEGTESPLELYNLGVGALRRGDRAGAYHCFLQAYQSGEKLPPRLEQRLEDMLQSLSPKRSTIQRTGGYQDANLPAQEGTLSDTESQTPGEPTEAAPSNLDRVDQQLAVKIDALRTQVMNGIFRADRAREKNPEEAIKILDKVQLELENSDLSKESITPLLRSVARARELAQASVHEQQANLDQKRHNKDVKDDLARESKTRVRIEQEFADLTTQFNDLMNQRRFSEAELIAKKAMELDPDNTTAEVMKWKALFAKRNFDNNNLKDQKERGFFDALDAVEHSAIPFDDRNPIVYGKDWKDLTQRRKGKYGPDNHIKTEEEKRIEKSLMRQVSMHFENEPLQSVINKLAVDSSINIRLDPQGLEEQQLTSDTPISIIVDGIQMKSALNLILEPLGMGYTIKDEVLKITSVVRQKGDLETRVYSVADLVIPLPNFANSTPNGFSTGGINSASITPSNGFGAPQFSMPPTGKRSAGQAFAQVPDAFSAQNNNMAAGGLVGERQVPEAMRQASVPDFDSLVELVVATVEPNSWDEVGGPASVRPFETTLSLVIRQTQQAHEEIQDLLAQLRRLQDLQVSIEVRFVTVSDKFFERIGIDFDFNVQGTAPVSNFNSQFGDFLPPFGGGRTYVNAGATTGTTTSGSTTSGSTTSGSTTTGTTTTGTTTSGTTSGTASGTGSAPFAPGPPRDLVRRGDYPKLGTIVGLERQLQFSNDLEIPFRQGSFDVGIPDFGSFKPDAGMSMGFAILSDIETFFFIQAAQGDSRSNILFAPKVTLFNGQLATVQDTLNRPFVVGQTPVVGAFTVAFTPNVQIIREGVILTVSAVVSADRRYVRLSLVPNFTSVTDVFTFTFSGAAGASGQQGGGTTTGFQGNRGGIGGGTSGGSTSGGTTSGGTTTSGTTSGTTTSGTTSGNTGVTSTGNVINAPVTQTVQQPVQEIISIQTAVSVPDGGTVLLGGIKRLKEGRNMSGVPILNKIPYVSRLFKNSGVGRETDSLMMMVTPRIIIQEEEEELLGVPL